MNFEERFFECYELSFYLCMPKLRKANMIPDKNFPVAKRQIKRLEKFGDVRLDPYYWMRERDSREVIDYLEAENRYYEAVTSGIRDFEKNLFEELKSRLKDEDESVPYFYKGWYFQTKYPKGKEYPLFLRWKDKNRKEIFFDANKRAEGHEFYAPGGLRISPDDRWLAFAEDFRGRRLYQIAVKDLKTGEIKEDEVIYDTTGSVVWQNDSKAFYYVKKNPVTLRAEKIYKHYVGTPVEEDRLIYEETNPEYDVHVSKSKTEDFIYIVIAANTSTEYRLKDAGSDADEFYLLQTRQKNVEYYPYHLGDKRFLVVTNEGGATDFQIKEAVWENGKWQYTGTFLPYRPGVLLEEIEVFSDRVVLTERENGLTRLRVLSLNKETDFYIPFDEETYTVYLGTNPCMDAKGFRFVYNSLTTPASVLEYEFGTGETKVLKEDEIPGGKFDKNQYASARVWAPGRDGTRIPVSLVWNKKINPKENNPLLLYGYGAYGITVDDNFSKNRLSLLDRGFIFAIAHVRGGEYLGRKWYEEGKLLKKKNTFYDFIDVARYLIEEGYTSPEKLYAMGGSAGGLLIGAVLNMAPELFRGAVAQVPFVDVLTTMLDESIPLTTGEYEEWGNPNEKVYYDYIKSYSPYDNVKAQAYPHLLVTAGYHDSQVQYWEPAKWVAKLRHEKTGENILLLYTDMKTGHTGAAGRFEAMRDTAREFSFILDLANRKNFI